jgi:hypothetical protein
MVRTSIAKGFINARSHSAHLRFLRSKFRRANQLPSLRLGWAGTPAPHTNSSYSGFTKPDCPQIWGNPANLNIHKALL